MYNGKRIAKLRKRKRIKQRELADYLGVCQKTISRYENNASYPSDDVKVLIAQYFGVSLDYFFELTDEEFPIHKDHYITLPEGYPPEYKKAMLFFKDLLNKNYNLK